eukprot:Plantae.Rhodophyta-Purpureofilum_apyrenoidigerum.ctg12097.p1 GENE.Plantae.Rhodophyta-Purpureofilum_apyrenoidigerum.ctg12097~~Plantae.Rhodophyta-Purpureofilum_apyrenoidigerum.ctg12097.p1  ORF type:complete len:176 (-),score=42.06 Plantae.Rhodophyta-Purpureofilum_apyrenoidigerum.ctg12097:274-801(-)
MKVSFRALGGSGEESQHVLIAGNCEALGSWKVKDALLLDQVSEGCFEGTIEVPEGTSIEYKYVIASSDKSGYVRWEKLGNRRVEAREEDFVQEDRPFEPGFDHWIAGETPELRAKSAEQAEKELSNGPAAKENGAEHVNGNDLDIPKEKLCKPFWKFWQSDEDFKKEVLEDMAKK